MLNRLCGRHLFLFLFLLLIFLSSKEKAQRPVRLQDLLTERHQLSFVQFGDHTFLGVFTSLQLQQFPRWREKMSGTRNYPSCLSGLKQVTCPFMNRPSSPRTCQLLTVLGPAFLTHCAWLEGLSPDCLYPPLELRMESASLKPQAVMGKDASVNVH